MKGVTTINKVFVFFSIAAAIETPAFAQNQKDSSAAISGTSTNKSEMEKQMIELSKTGENHKLLASLTGSWAFAGRHIPPDPNIKPIEFKGTVERKAIMDGRYFICETTGGKLVMPWSDGKEMTYRDMTIEGYDNTKKKFYRAMIANHWSTNIMTTEGSYDPATKTFTYEGEMERAGTTRKFRDLLKIISSHHYLFERWVSSGGREIQIMESNFTRVGK